ncbi:hypothetical protein OG21DRAFT_1405451, partial [Imleria badia]
GLVYWDGLVGHCGKNGCWLFCGVSGRHKDTRSHYYPAFLRPHNSTDVSNHSMNLCCNVSSIHSRNRSWHSRKK